MLDRAVIVGEQIHTPNLDVEDFSFFSGNVTANAASFGPGVVISGDFRANTVMGNPAVAGTFTTGVVSGFPDFINSETAPTYLPSIDTEPDENIALEPGAYWVFDIAERSTVTLTAGTYGIVFLSAAEDVTFNFDVSDGPIEFLALDDIQLGDRSVFRVQNGHPTDVAVHTANNLVIGDDDRAVVRRYSKLISPSQTPSKS